MTRWRHRLLVPLLLALLPLAVPKATAIALVKGERHGGNSPTLHTRADRWSDYDGIVGFRPALVAIHSGPPSRDDRFCQAFVSNV